jgi:hypothetical protein
MMNDFTKEELIELRTYLKFGAWVNCSIVVNKIQSMIDNYCEPSEPTESNILENICCGEKWFFRDDCKGIAKCQKCGCLL